MIVRSFEHDCSVEIEHLMTVSPGLGWGVPPLDAQSLPREVTWNPELQQLCYAPLREQASLRSAPLAVPKGGTVALEAGKPVVLGGGSGWAGSVGNASEFITNFTLPRAATTFGLAVMAGADVTSSGTFFFVEYLPADPEVEWPRTVVVGAMTNRSGAEANGFSCLGYGVQCANDTLQLTERDTAITLRAFVDNNLAECYWQDNRVAMMVHTPATTQAAAALVSTAEAVAVTDMVAWQVGSIWISTEELLATPHPDERS
jgi:hypothetical protein